MGLTLGPPAACSMTYDRVQLNASSQAHPLYTCIGPFTLV